MGMYKLFLNEKKVFQFKLYIRSNQALYIYNAKNAVFVEINAPGA